MTTITAPKTVKIGKPTNVGWPSVYPVLTTDTNYQIGKVYSVGRKVWQAEIWGAVIPGHASSKDAAIAQVANALTWSEDQITRHRAVAATVKARCAEVSLAIHIRNGEDDQALAQIAKMEAALAEAKALIASVKK